MFYLDLLRPKTIPSMLFSNPFRIFLHNKAMIKSSTSDYVLINLIFSVFFLLVFLVLRLKRVTL